MSDRDRNREIWFWIGIFFLPSIFTWFTLRKKYSFTARTIAFAWLIFICILVYGTESATLGDFGLFLIPLTVIVVGNLLLNRDSQGAIVKGTAGKTLIFKSLRLLFFGSKKAFDVAAKGMEGERKVGKILKGLPDGWRVWHDLDIGGENIDHVIASAKGIFVIEMKNYSGNVLVTSCGIYTHGRKKPNKKISAQVIRQIYTLKEKIGAKFINPVLVFSGKINRNGDSKKARGITCLQLNELLPYLRSLKKNYLSYEEAKGFFDKLDQMTK